MKKQIFINLPVENLNATKHFFTQLGFEFNPQFSNENGTCMIIDENIFAMLLTKPFYKSFIKKEICDSSLYSESIIAISSESRHSVDELLNKALIAGAQEYRPAEDHGWMYGRSFEDLDGHLWEVVYMEQVKPEQVLIEDAAANI